MITRNRANLSNSKGSADITFLERVNVAIYGGENNVRTQAPSIDALEQIRF